VASAGAASAAPYPPAVPSGGSTLRARPRAPRSGSSGAASPAAATPAAAPNVLRIQVPIDIGDVGLATRNMLMNRAGRPRSLARK
jgi:hypothetical protein